MIVINLWAGPGSGKSTGAAYIFSKLKMAGINAELVTEFAKDKVWEDNRKALANQAYMFGQQYYRISRLEGEVDVAIVDSPLMLSLLYNNDPKLGNDFNQVVRKVANSYDSLNYFVKRVKKYNPKGRLQTESESDALSEKIKAIMDAHLGSYQTIDGNVDGYDTVVMDVLRYLRYSPTIPGNQGR